MRFAASERHACTHLNAAATPARLDHTKSRVVRRVCSGIAPDRRIGEGVGFCMNLHFESSRYGDVLDDSAIEADAAGPPHVVEIGILPGIPSTWRAAGMPCRSTDSALGWWRDPPNRPGGWIPPRSEALRNRIGLPFASEMVYLPFQRESGRSRRKERPRIESNTTLRRLSGIRR